MTKNQKIGATCVFFIIMVVGLKIYKKYNIAPSIKFKSLELTDLQDNKVKWDSIPKPVFINYFGTWCVDCRKEMPALMELNHILKEQNIHMILISDETTTSLQQYMTKNNIDLPIYHCETSFKELGIYKFPTSYVVDKYDNIVYSATDVQPWTDKLTVEKIKKALR